MVEDRDLLSIQQARTLVANAHKAWESFAHFSQEDVDRIVHEAASAASFASLKLAQHAVEETGYGVVEHKFIKNKFAAVDIYQFIKDMKTVGIIREIQERKIFEIAEPLGVVAAVVPSTNPTSTTIYKILISLKSRNAVVLSPHPGAEDCVRRTTELMREAAESVGLPPGVVACMTDVTLEGTQELMQHRRTAVILATGGMGLVRAAYSSGRPAYGVGPGNVPAYIESTADVKKAVRDIITGKSYDNGTLCCSEQALICDQDIRSVVREEVMQQGGFFLSLQQIEELTKIAVLPSGTINPKIVGKSANFIAEKAGFTVPEGTRALVVELDGVGRDYPLSVEKLSPILAFYVVRDWKEGCERSKQILAYGGMGHTLAIHSKREEVIREFALQKPASRIVVNTPATYGAVGFSTGLAPAMTLGCGSYGGNITSDNITPMHLINIKRLAYETRGVDCEQALNEYGFSQAERELAPKHGTATVTTTIETIEDQVEQFLDRRGLAGVGMPPHMSFDVEPTPSSNIRNEISRVEPVEPMEPMEFVSEDDVRRALQEDRKLLVGPETIITPSARELGNERSIFLHV